MASKYNMPQGMYKGQPVDTVPTRYLMWWATLAVIPKRNGDIFVEVMRVIHERTANPEGVLQEFLDVLE